MSDAVNLPISWFTTTRIWLHLEPYTNAGLSSERATAILREMPDPGNGTLSLRVQSMGVNRNLIVETSLVDSHEIRDLVGQIEQRLTEETRSVQRGR